MDENALITSTLVCPKRSAKTIEGTEKTKIPSKFAKRAARNNKFGCEVFFVYSQKNRHPGKLHCTFFLLLEKIALLSILKDGS